MNPPPGRRHICLSSTDIVQLQSGLGIRLQLPDPNLVQLGNQHLDRVGTKKPNPKNPQKNSNIKKPT